MTGGQFQSTSKVKNTGSTTLRNVVVQLFDNDRSLGSRTISSLAPGAIKTLTTTWTPSSTKTHVVKVVVDPKNVINESNEADNKLQRTITR